MNENQKNVPGEVGVSELIDRLKAEGVAEGQQQADAIVSAAKDEAAAILEAARTEADKIEQAARDEADRTRTNGTQALKLASRDTAIQLREQLEQTFRGWIGRLVEQRVSDPEFLGQLIRDMASQASAEARRIDVSVAEKHAAGLEAFVESQASEMLRDGVEIRSDRSIEGGFRFKIDGSEVEIDFTDDAVTAAMMRLLAPKFRQLISRS
jgi:V/A-type H+-transporting ATPase subunit E